MNDKEYYTRTAGAIADYLFQQMGLDPRQHYRVVTATSGPRVLTLNLAVYPAYAPKILAMAGQLSMAAGLDREASIRATRGNRGTLALEIPKPRALWYDISVDVLGHSRGLNVPVGLDVEHRPARINFGNALTPHLLAAGTTGSGKTNTARLLVYDLATGNRSEDVGIMLIDTRKRGSAWRPFDALPHLVHPVITAEDEALRALAWASAEIDRRAGQVRDKPHIFVVIDEAQALLDRPEFQRPICDVAATGREFGIHLLLATQNPTSDMLPTGIKRNVTARVVFKTDSAQSAVVAAGISQTGAELLTGPGDGLLVQPSGTRRITAALVRPCDLEDLPRCDGVGNLDLDQYDDVDRVLAQADNRAAIEPEHVARALAFRRGITWLTGELGIGSKRARRVKEFADSVLAELELLGYTVIPHTRMGLSASVTESGAIEGV